MKQATHEPMTSDTPSRLHQWTRRGWFLVAAVAVGILLASIPGYLLSNPLGLFEDRLVIPASSWSPWIFGLISLVSFASALLSYGLAVLLFVKKSDDRMGLFLAYYLLIYGVLLAGPIEQLYPFWPAAPWVNSFVLLPFLIGPLTTALIGIFPDGRFVPGWVKWIVPLSLLVFVFSFLAGEVISAFEFTFPDPLVAGGGLISSIGLAVILIYAQVHRYRRVSSLAERQQTKIVLYGIAAWFALLGLSSTAWIWGFSQAPGTPAPWWFSLGSLVWSISTLVLPACLTIAVLRYGLFQIDILVNRTLVYGVLTGLLALVYFGLVTLLQDLLSVVSGQRSAAAIVVSTLAIAGLFNPLRGRVQAFIDRRFYRHRYDAVQTLEAFSNSLREKVDLMDLSKALLGMVEETLQPEHASLWLRATPSTDAPASVRRTVERKNNA